MKKLVALLLVSMMATVAFAGLDPDPDSFGVYLDVNGMNNNLGPATAVTKTVYVVLMNPTTDLKGFEFGYELVPSPAMAPTFVDDLVRTSQVIFGTSFVDIGNSADPVVGDFRCGYAVARPAAPAMVVVTWKFRYYGEVDEGIDFYIKGVATNPSMPGGLPVVDSGAAVDNLRRAGIASGSTSLPCASTVFGPVAQEVNSFGSVKSLFR